MQVFEAVDKVANLDNVDMTVDIPDVVWVANLQQDGAVSF